jgi:ATP-binding cassette subfamily F protein 3
VVFQNEKIQLFEGTYQQFLDKEGWSDEVDEKGGLTGMPEDMPVSTKRSKKTIRRLRSEIIMEKSQKIKPLDKQIKKVEENIDLLEKNVHILNEAMLDASQSNDGGKISEISREIHKDQANIECLFAEMEQLYHDKEQAENYFIKKLKEIEI